jgi:ankyrin repeat protein
MSTENPFGTLPKEIWERHIIPIIPLNWLYISRSCNKIAETFLLEDERINPAAQACKGLRRVIAQRNVKWVDKLLQDTRVDPSTWQQWAIRYASADGCAPIVELLLKHKKTDPSVPSQDPLIYACRNGHTEVVRLLLEDERVDVSFSEHLAFREAVKSQSIEIIRLLYACPRFVPLNWDFPILKLAVTGTNLELVKTIAELDPRLDAELSDEVLADVQRADIMKLLIDRGKDPSVGRQLAIRTASYHGRVDVVRVLLQDPRVIPSTVDNLPIRVAAQHGNVELVKLLLADPRVDPACKNDTPLNEAARNGHAEVVSLLLADSRVHPARGKEHAIHFAAVSGCLTVVNVLLEDPRVDPASGDNEALIRAAINYWKNPQSYGEVIKRLLSCAGVNIRARNYHCFKPAVKTPQLLDLLLQVSDVKKEEIPADILTPQRD